MSDGWKILSVSWQALLLFLTERQGKSEPAAGDEPTAETESESEAELSGFSPVVRAQQSYAGTSPSSLGCPSLRTEVWSDCSHTGKEQSKKSLRRIPRDKGCSDEGHCLHSGC